MIQQSLILTSTHCFSNITTLSRSIPRRNSLNLDYLYHVCGPACQKKNGTQIVKSARFWLIFVPLRAIFSNIMNFNSETGFRLLSFIEIRPWKRKKKFKKDERASERWSHFEWWLCECERMSDDVCNREITKNSRVLKALNHFNFSFALWGASSKLLTQTIADDNL